MKHATEKTLNKLEPLLKEIDKIELLKKKKLGIYYFKSKSFLHFHEDGEKIFADVRLEGSDFNRLPVTSNEEQKILVESIKKKFGLT